MIILEEVTFILLREIAPRKINSPLEIIKVSPYLLIDIWIGHCYFWDS